MQLEWESESVHVIEYAISERPMDVGLMGLLADMAGGQVVIANREPCECTTTHLEVIGVASLRGPGLVVGRSRLIGMSRKRGVVETVFELGGERAVSHSSFAVNEGILTRMTQPKEPRNEPLAVPLWEFIGATRTADGAYIDLGPTVANHTGTMQGGSTIALAEAAALSAVHEGETLDSVSIHYMKAVRGSRASATATRFGRSIVVDVHTDVSSTLLSRLVFAVV